MMSAGMLGFVIILQSFSRCFTKCKQSVDMTKDHRINDPLVTGLTYNFSFIFNSFSVLITLPNVHDLLTTDNDK